MMGRVVPNYKKTNVALGKHKDIRKKHRNQSLSKNNFIELDRLGS